MGGLDKALALNGSGYFDPTAYKALKKYESERETMKILRGEMYNYDFNGYVKQVLIVSSDERGEDAHLNGIILEDEPRADNVVEVKCGSLMYANCDRVAIIKNDRVGTFIRKATDDEMKLIDEGICEALGLKIADEDGVIKQLKEDFAKANAENEELNIKNKRLVNENAKLLNGDFARVNNDLAVISKLEAERDIYKQQFESLLEKLVGKAV